MRFNICFDSGFYSLTLGKGEGKIYEWQQEFSDSAKQDDFIVCDGKMNPLFLIAENTPKGYERPSSKITESRWWCYRNVIDLCVKNNFYTCGCNREYEYMLDFVREHEPTVQNLYKVANDILSHSNDEANNNYVVTDIMMLLEKNTVLIDYFIED